MNIFTFDKSRYFTRNVLPGYFMLAIAVYSLFSWVTNFGFNLWPFVLVVSIYGAANQFLLIANPQEIRVDDKTVSFSAMGRTHTYEIADLEYFHIKEMTISDMVWVRAKDNHGHSGRYWVHYYFIDRKMDLLAELYYIERGLHPTHIKFRGRDEWGANRPGVVLEGTVTHESDAE